MGSLSSELGPVAERLVEVPRVYVDANLPAGLVRFMRDALRWDVFFVLEHDDLRRATDLEHFRLAAQLHRTLLTLDRDYLDDQRFPPSASSGVIVLSAPREERFERLLRQIDRSLFLRNHPEGAADAEAGGPPALPLLGRKLHVHTDWVGEQS